MVMMFKATLFQQDFSYNVAVSFTGGGKWSTVSKDQPIKRYLETLIKSDTATNVGFITTCQTHLR